MSLSKESTFSYILKYEPITNKCKMKNPGLKYSVAVCIVGIRSWTAEFRASSAHVTAQITNTACE